MKRRTKIIATLGPASEDPAILKSLVHAGMDIVRLNCSHGNEAQFRKIIREVRRLEKETGKWISIFIDLQGPKIRLGKLEQPVPVQRNQELLLTTNPKNKEGIYIPYPPLTKVVKEGQRLLIEDGLLRSKVIAVSKDTVRVKFLNKGVLKSRKGINLPDSKLPNSEALPEKDREDLKMGLKLGIDAVAVSFVEQAADLERIRDEIHKYSKETFPIIAKIERPKALRNLKALIQSADAVMVARGDLGIETKAERLPLEQKRIIALSRKMGKPVIIATQILQSMVESPLPTRAEVSDAANAIFDHADGFMLSNETAVGAYPIRAVETLARIARETEEAIFRSEELTPLLFESFGSKDESIAYQACEAAESMKAKRIVIQTKTGHTARMVLKHRPNTPTFIVTSSIKTARTINLLWGAEEIVVDRSLNTLEEISDFLKKGKWVQKGDQIVFVKLSGKKRSLSLLDIE